MSKMDDIDTLVFSIDRDGLDRIAFMAIALNQGTKTIVWLDLVSTTNNPMKTTMDKLAEFHNQYRKSSKIPLAVIIEPNSRIDGNKLTKLIATSIAPEYANIHLVMAELTEREHRKEEPSMTK